MDGTKNLVEPAQKKPHTQENLLQKLTRKMERQVCLTTHIKANLEICITCFDGLPDTSDSQRVHEPHQDIPSRRNVHLHNQHCEKYLQTFLSLPQLSSDQKLQVRIQNAVLNLPQYLAALLPFDKLDLDTILYWDWSPQNCLYPVLNTFKYNLLYIR